MFLISSFGVQARGIQIPNVMIAVLIFFGGVCQYLVGIMEFVSGNSFGCTVFASYGAFNVSYSMIYLPGSGIIAAYTDPTTGELSPQFSQAIALYLWAWFILTVIFTIAAMRSSWVLFLDLFMLDITLMILAIGNMTGNETVNLVGYGIGYVVAILSCKSCDVEGCREDVDISLTLNAYTQIGPASLACTRAPHPSMFPHFRCTKRTKSCWNYYLQCLAVQSHRFAFRSYPRLTRSRRSKDDRVCQLGDPE